MAKVLHVVPADASLTGFGLEAWVDAGRGFLPVVAAVDAGQDERWDAFTVHRVAPMRPGLAWLAAKLRREADPWTALMLEQGVGLVHLHDWSVATEVTEAADGLDLPVVATWPGHGVPRVPHFLFDHVFAPSPARADHARGQLRSAIPVRMAPPPVHPPDERARTLALRAGRAEGRGMRWVTAVTDGERERLGLAVRAFGRYAREATDVPELLILVAGPWLEEARAIAAAYAPGVELTVLPVSGGTATRTALASAQAALFPLALAEPRRGEGLTWPAWVAASIGLPMVLGRGPAEVDGFLDHQHALLADPGEEALAARMAFLAARPYVWPTLGETAMRLAVGRLAFDRACDIPFEVYRQVLGARAVAIS